MIECTPERTLEQTPPLDVVDGYQSDSESESDCEIIEVDTPVIVLDDDCASEPNQVDQPISEGIEQSTSVDESGHKTGETQTGSETVTSTVCNDDSVKSTADSSIEVGTPDEPVQLFFVDKNPNTNFEAPIYDLAATQKTNTNGIMTSTPKNFRITFTNTSTNFERSFASNPLLSSTRLNGSVDDGSGGASSASSSTSNSNPNTATNFHISINSTCENGSTRMVSVNKKVPTAKEPPNNSNSDGKSNEKNSRKRKIEKENREEPPSKKSSTDVIVLNDTISDEDSVIFVSETANVQKRTRIAGNSPNYSGKAADFISLRDDKETQQPNTVS